MGYTGLAENSWARTRRGKFSYSLGRHSLARYAYKTPRSTPGVLIRRYGGASNPRRRTMRIRTMIPALTLTLLHSLLAGAQTPGAANGPNQGVTPVRQIDRAEVRVTRVELQPGAVRSESYPVRFPRARNPTQDKPLDDGLFLNRGCL